MEMNSWFKLFDEWARKHRSELSGNRKKDWQEFVSQIRKLTGAKKLYWAKLDLNEIARLLGCEYTNKEGWRTDGCFSYKIMDERDIEEMKKWRKKHPNKHRRYGEKRDRDFKKVVKF